MACNFPLVLLVLTLVIAPLSPRSAAAQEKPFELLVESWKPFADPLDALGFPMKVRAIAQSPYHFWRGGKDFFFAWVKVNATDWAQQAGYPGHGDLHFGNLGVYASEGSFGAVAFGMTDFDDSTSLPIPLQLLDGAITLRLAAIDTSTDYTPDDAAHFTHDLIDAYRVALNYTGDATAQLQEVKPIAKLLKKANKETYDELLNKMIESGKFRKLLRNKEGDVTNILRPAMARADDVATVIAQAAQRSPRLKALMRSTDVAGVRASIKDVALRTRLGSSGSQGLFKILVLLDKPLVGVNHDVLFYLKQEIPSAAERQRVVKSDTRSPGERVSAMNDLLTDPDGFANSSGEAQGKSYWVQIYEPWSDDLNADAFGGLKGLSAGGRVWGTTLGTAHRAHASEIATQLTPELELQINERADAYIVHMKKRFEDFRSDPRVRAMQIEADRAVMQLTQ